MEMKDFKIGTVFIRTSPITPSIYTIAKVIKLATKTKPTQCLILETTNPVLRKYFWVQTYTPPYCEPFPLYNSPLYKAMNEEE